MKRGGFLPAILVGALFGCALLLVAALVAQRSLSGKPLLARADKGVLVGLVLPDQSGDIGVRAVVYYPPGDAPGRVVDPASHVVVAGTSSNTLGDAYAFGGGASLAAAYARLASVDTPAWVLVEPGAWKDIGRSVSVHLPRPVDVFNGSNLVSFPGGEVLLGRDQVGTLLGGLSRLPAAERRAILGEVASALQDALTAADGRTKLGTDLTPGALTTWMSSLGERSRPETASP